MANPVIAAYTESVFGLQREFTLYADHLEIAGSRLIQPQRVRRIPLEHLDENYDRHRTLSLQCRSGIGVVVLSAAVAAMWLQFGGSLTDQIAAFLWAVGIGGVLVAILTCRRVEYVHFRGKSPFYIARTGIADVRFDSFVDSLYKTLKERNEP